MTKKHLNYLFFAAAAMLAASCSNDFIENGSTPSSDSRVITVAASTANDESSTRVGYTASTTAGKADMHWQAGDQLGLFYTESSGTEIKQTSMSLKSGSENQPNGFFESSEAVSGTPRCVVYPYKEGTTISNNTLSYTFPSEYSYTSVSKGDNSVNIPYYGKLKGTEDVTASNFSTTLSALGGVLAVKVPCLPASSGYVTLISNHKICGTFTTSLSGNNAPSAFSVSSSTTGTASERSVTIQFSGASTESSSDGNWFYFPLPVGSHTLSLQIACLGTSVSDQAYFYTTAKAISVEITQGKIVEKSLGKVTADSYTKAKSYKSKENVYVSDANSDDYFIKGDNDRVWHEMMDLGITTTDSKKLLFATMNVGAFSVSDYGNYYAWGETETKSTYSSSTYNVNNYPGSSGVYVLEGKDDAAYVNWGSSFRMPTLAEFEKFNSCTWTWTTENTVNGYKVTGNSTAGSSIFLPASGYYDGSNLNDKGSKGYYWSSKLNESYTGYSLYLYFASNGHSADKNSDRYYGRSVRAVSEL